MRIGLVVCALNMGGVATVLKRLNLFLREAGHQVAFVQTQSRGSGVNEFQKRGFRVVDVLPRSTRSRVHHARRIARALQEYDAVLLNDTPYAKSVLGLLPDRTVAISILHMLLPSMVKNAIGNHDEVDAIVVVNPVFKNVLARRFTRFENRTFAIANAVEVSDEWPKRGVAAWGRSVLRVIHAGRIEDRQKGSILLPQIVEEAREFSLDVRLDIVGDGPDLPRLKRHLGTATGGSGSTLHGTLSHEATVRLLAESDVLLMPSRFEGLPMVLLEAMALGVVPVVTSLDGIADHVVRDGENGFLVNVDDVEGFARALVRAAEDREQLKAMSEAAWQTVRDRFDSRSMGRSYLDLINDLRRQRSSNACKPRSRSIDKSLLGDLPHIPVRLVRPCRRLLRVARLWPLVQRFRRPGA